MEIDGRKIGPGHPPYIIAEMSNNHLGSVDRAKAIICRAKAAGADAVKIQTYDADALTIDANGPEFFLNTPLWKGKTYYQLYQEAALPMEHTRALFDTARDEGITLFSSPFGRQAVDLLTDLNCPAFKIASFEAVDPEFIRLVAGTGKPVLISTGISSLAELDMAAAVLEKSGAGEVLLFHCVSQYPAELADYQLKALDVLKSFSPNVGLSDHSLGLTAAGAAVALGGCAIEKHFTLSRRDGGPDAAFSVEPDELQKLKDHCVKVWQSLGSGDVFRDEHRPGREHARSLYVVQDLAPGQVLTRDHIRSIRPGRGLAPRFMAQVLGRTVNQRLSRGTALKWEYLK